MILIFFQIFRECEENVFQTDVLLVGLHAKHFNRRTCNQHLLLRMFYCTHDYYSRFSIPLTLIYQLHFDRCLIEQKAHACSVQQNLKSFSDQILLLIIQFYTYSLHSPSKQNSYTLFSAIQIFVYTLPQTSSFHNLCSNGHYSFYLGRC